MKKGVCAGVWLRCEQSGIRVLSGFRMLSSAAVLLREWRVGPWVAAEKEPSEKGRGGEAQDGCDAAAMGDERPRPAKQLVISQEHACLMNTLESRDRQFKASHKGAGD
jgi:hypothetical protein